MKSNFIFGTAMAVSLLFASCSEPKTEAKVESPSTDFQYQAEQFADLKLIRYRIPDWDRLSAQQKELVYYLTQAGYAGRDIIWDQNYRHNLTIRRALEKVVTDFDGDKSSAEWGKFMEYTKRIWFANGIHHHYSMNKIMPEFDRAYLESLLAAVDSKLEDEVMNAIFDPAVDNKKVSLDSNKDLILASATNFYGEDVTEAEVDAYYATRIDKKDRHPISYGLNSKLARNEKGELEEQVWKADGMYGASIQKIIYWLEKAAGVAENQKQGDALRLLIKYYKSGNLRDWDNYNIAWAGATDGDIDYINSFIEVYNDPKGFRGSYESIIQIKDFDMTEKMQVLAENVQWFEDNSPIMEEHKKKNVVGVSYKVVNVAGESGDASPATPIGVNLPNANWIRVKHGSKSVSLGNIVRAYAGSSGSSVLEEFANDEEEVKRAKEHSKLAAKLHTAMHEVIGHASGQINEGVGTPKETLKNYASTLEEGRADLVALYYLMDNKLVDLGLMPSLEVGKAEYDNYIRNGLMTQLQRLKPGEVVEEAHMRNRQMVAAWAFEKGAADNVISKLERDGKTYYEINDYMKLQDLFGQLLTEIQRIKSEGDYEAGKALVENYGVQVDAEHHKQVLARVEKLEIAPYGGFINPKLVPVEENGKIIDVKVEYPMDFTQQMLEYAKDHSFLPDYN